MSDSGRKTSFGDREVSPDEKTRLVGGVFDAVAHRYDQMNDLMSLGSHRLMKRLLVEMAGVRENHIVLDLAGGTGDLARLLARSVGETGNVVLADINAAMLSEGRDRLLDDGTASVNFCRAAAETLPFPADCFDRVVIGFGLRNFTDKQAALGEIKRVLKLGGVLLVLEFSKPTNPVLEGLSTAWQSFWPAMGQLVAGDGGSYRYLIESIQAHPTQEALKLMMEDAGFSEVEFHNLLGGIAAIHRGVNNLESSNGSETSEVQDGDSPVELAEALSLQRGSKSSGFQDGDGPHVQRGRVNEHNQRCCGHRGNPGNLHRQKAYKMECLECGNVYGANGCDVHERRCPSCQGGAPGIKY